MRARGRPRGHQRRRRGDRPLRPDPRHRGPPDRHRRRSRRQRPRPRSTGWPRRCSPRPASPGRRLPVGVGVPGLVEFSTGRPSHPPIMPGWHDYPIPSAFRPLRVPGLRGQRRERHGAGRDGGRRVGPGPAGGEGRDRIGCGVIVDGRVYREGRAAPGTSARSTSPSPTAARWSAGAATRTARRRSPAVGPSCPRRHHRGAPRHHDTAGRRAGRAGDGPASNWSATPAGRSARCSRPWSTSSTRTASS